MSFQNPFNDSVDNPIHRKAFTPEQAAAMNGTVAPAATPTPDVNTAAPTLSGATTLPATQDGTLQLPVPDPAPTQDTQANSDNAADQADAIDANLAAADAGQPLPYPSEAAAAGLSPDAISTDAPLDPPPGAGTASPLLGNPPIKGSWQNAGDTAGIAAAAELPYYNDDLGSMTSVPDNTASSSGSMILCARGTTMAVDLLGGADYVSKGYVSIEEWNIYKPNTKSAAHQPAKGVPPFTAPLLLTGLRIGERDIYGAMACLNNQKVFYTFGQNFGDVTIIGEILLGNFANQSTSAARRKAFVDFFWKYRVSQFKAPVHVSVLGEKYLVYLVGLDFADIEPDFHILPFVLHGVLLDISRNQVNQVDTTSLLLTTTDLNNSSVIAALNSRKGVISGLLNPSGAGAYVQNADGTSSLISAPDQPAVWKNVDGTKSATAVAVQGTYKSAPAVLQSLGTTVTTDPKTGVETLTNIKIASGDPVQLKYAQNILTIQGAPTTRDNNGVLTNPAAAAAEKMNNNVLGPQIVAQANVDMAVAEADLAAENTIINAQYPADPNDPQNTNSPNLPTTPEAFSNQTKQAAYTSSVIPVSLDYAEEYAANMALKKDWGLLNPIAIN